MINEMDKARFILYTRSHSGSSYSYKESIEGPWFLTCSNIQTENLLPGGRKPTKRMPPIEDLIIWSRKWTSRIQITTNNQQKPQTLKKHEYIKIENKDELFNLGGEIFGREYVVSRPTTTRRKRGEEIGTEESARSPPGEETTWGRNGNREPRFFDSKYI